MRMIGRSGIGIFAKSEWGNQPSSFLALRSFIRRLRLSMCHSSAPRGDSKWRTGWANPFWREGPTLSKSAAILIAPWASPKIHPSIGPLFFISLPKSLISATKSGKDRFYSDEQNYDLAEVWWIVLCGLRQVAMNSWWKINTYPEWTPKFPSPLTEPMANDFALLSHLYPF